MKRPYIVCHILSTLDGKIEGASFGTPPARAASGEYARIRDEYHADAWLYGTTTTKEFTAFRKPILQESGAVIPQGDFVAQSDANLYYISIDTAGEIGWESGLFRKAGRPDAHVIEVLTETTPVAYRHYLRQKGVSYILAGNEALDCRLAAQKLYDLFGIETVLLCGGGTINWTFLQQGMVDELSLLLAPVADGSPDTVPVFLRADFLSESDPARFHLKKAEPLKESVVRLLYMVDRPE